MLWSVRNEGDYLFFSSYLFMQLFVIQIAGSNFLMGSKEGRRVTSD